jgi:hypothetical protein
MGAAKSYMRKGFVIYEETGKYLVIYSMRKALVIYDFATVLFWISLHIYEEKFLIFSVYSM